MKTKFYIVLLAMIGLAHTISFAQNAENQNPYAIFGSKPYIAGEQANRERVKVFVIENIAKDATVARLEHNTETGVVTSFDKEGNAVRQKKLKKGERAWPTQDRFAKKYYPHSPYSYAAGNPIRYIDINGDSLWINHRGTEVLYVDGSLYNRDGSIFTGKQSRFIQKTVSALSVVGGTATGAKMISELQGSDNNFTIVKGANKFVADNRVGAYASQAFESMLSLSGVQDYDALFGGSGGTISWSPSGASIPTTNGYSNNPAMVLGHEMAHAWDANRGELSSTIVDGYSKSEWQAVYNENMMRGQAGLPLRTHYGSSATPDGIKTGGIGPRMLTPTNVPYVKHYSVYYP